MRTQELQYDLFIKDLRELEKMQNEEKAKKANKRLRAAFHVLGDLSKEMKQKTL